MKKSKHSCDLKSCFVCRNVLKDWLPAITGNRSNLVFKKGERLFQEGELVTGIYLIYSGKVKVHKDWGAFKELILRFGSAGDIVGHFGLMTEQRYPASVTAIEPCTACFLDINFFETTLRVNPEFMHHMLIEFADDLRESEHRMRNLAHMPVKGRIAQSLLALEQQFGITEANAINIILSRQDLASYAGTTYETVFRIINEMTDDNLVQVSGKNIVLLNRDGLLHFTRETATAEPVHQVQQSTILS